MCDLDGTIARVRHVFLIAGLCAALPAYAEEPTPAPDDDGGEEPTPAPDDEGGEEAPAPSEDETEAPADRVPGSTVVTSKRPWRPNRRAGFELDPDVRPGARLLTRRDLDWQPGTYGDLQRALHRLPGISGDTGNLSAFNIRGGEPYEAWTAIDGIRIRYATHLAGFTSLFDPDLVSSVRVDTGAPSATTRSGLSGAVHVGYIDGPHDRVDGLLDLNFLQLSGHVAVDVDRTEDDKAAVVVGARYSLLDLYIGAWKATGEIDPEFDTVRYIDSFVRTTFKPRDNDRVRVSGLFSTDRLLLDDVNAQTFVGGASIDWDRELPTADLRARFTWSLNRVQEPDAGDFVYPNPRRWSETQHRIEGLFGAEKQLNDRVRLRVGASGAAVYVRGEGEFLRTSSLPPWAPLPLADYGLDRIDMAAGWWRPDVALWIEADAKNVLGPLQLVGGLRVAVAGLGYVDFEPRLTAAVPLPTKTLIKASVGVVSQPRYEAELLHPRFGNPELAPERAVMADVVVEQKLPGKGDGVVALGGFFKRYDRLVVSTGALGLAWSPAPNSLNPVYTNDGVGWAAGLEAQVQGRIKRFGGSVAYTLVFTERTNPYGLRFTDPIAPSGDQRHDVTASMDVLLGKKKRFRVSAMYAFKSGRPVADLAPVQQSGDTWTWSIVGLGDRRFDPLHRVNLRFEHTIMRTKVLVRGIAEVNAEPFGAGFVENCDSVPLEGETVPACAPFGFLPPVRPWLGLKFEW